MILHWLPLLSLLLVCIVLNNYIKWNIPEKDARIKFKAENEFYLVLAYLLTPLLMLQGELIFLNNTSVTFEELKLLLFLFIVKVSLFILAGKNLETFLSNLKAFKSYKSLIQSE